MSVRIPAVAGIFYPGDRFMLENQINTLLTQAKQHSPFPKAIIVPHAGYAYSGAIAASAYASLKQNRNQIKKIVLLGPAHTLYFKGIAYDSKQYFSTPLGEIKQDQDLLNKIIHLPYVHELPEAHQNEHCLEVQWPFCQVLFSNFSILPLVVGETNEKDVSRLLNLIWGDPDTLIIISTDLSHYLPYNLAQTADHDTCMSIDTLDDESIHQDGACGYYALRGFLHCARQKQLHGRLLDLRNSGDTAGNKQKVVGYASYHFYENLKFADHCIDDMLHLAKESIRMHCIERKNLSFNVEEYHDLLQIRVPTFITLKKNNSLRGCMGSVHSQQYLGDNIIRYAKKAAFEDPRFSQLDYSELKDLSISISLLSPLAPIEFDNEQDLKSQLKQGIDGLVLKYSQYQATFLPSVWESIESKDEFIEQLKMKMGLPAHFWSSEFKAYRYTTESIE